MLVEIRTILQPEFCQTPHAMAAICGRLPPATPLSSIWSVPRSLPSEVVSHERGGIAAHASSAASHPPSDQKRESITCHK